MHVVNLLTALAITMMTGNELAVSLFIDPALWRLRDSAMTSELARSLGKYMPFWYGGCLALLALCTYVHHGASGRRDLLCATILWALTIGYTLAFLVPINNRLAAGTLPASEELAQHKRWDTLHRWRIGALFVACLLALVGMQL